MMPEQRRDHDRESQVLITDVGQITPEWLTDKLRAGGVLHGGEVSQVTVVSQASNRGIFANTASLAARYSEDASGSAPARLFLKMSKPGLHAELLAKGQREVSFYQAMAVAPQSFPLPGCYDAVYDAETGHSHLLLDDLSETHFQKPYPLPPSPGHCEMVVEGLARLHAHWWDSPRLRTELGGLGVEGAAGERHRRLAETFPGFMDFLGDALLPAQCRMYEQILASPLLSRREERCRETRRVTLLHGDPHPGNFMLPKDSDRGQVILVDWHLWEMNVATDDLAFLIAHQWSPHRRAALEKPLLQQYHRHLIARGVENYDWPDCWDDYRGSVAVMTLVPIGQFRRKQHPAVLWSGLETSTAAFQDLNCAEVL